MSSAKRFADMLSSVYVPLHGMPGAAVFNCEALACGAIRVFCVG